MDKTVKIEVQVPFVVGRGGKPIVACCSAAAQRRKTQCFAYDETRHEHYACTLGAATYPALGDVYPSTGAPDEGTVKCPIVAALAKEVKP